MNIRSPNIQISTDSSSSDEESSDSDSEVSLEVQSNDGYSPVGAREPPMRGGYGPTTWWGKNPQVPRVPQVPQECTPGSPDCP
jgi:hypothetical protein